jgi:threonine/homoserine/homoserine lactone efflux protein
MIAPHDLILFALAALILALTPGPNMAYLMSRTLCQGRRAGMVSLAGTTLGFTAHMLASACGLSALLFAVPLAFDVVKYAGAAYLLWMAWNALKPGAALGVAPAALTPASDSSLFRMALITSLLNPKVAMFYIALLPQFIDSTHGSVLAQGIALGFVQITICAAVDFALYVLAASAIASWLAARPLWLKWQGRLMALVLAGLAVRLALESRK